MSNRFSQFYKAVRAKILPEEYQWAKNLLSIKEFELFNKQALPDKRHALDVALEIQKQKTVLEKTLGINVYNNLLIASLLHDCGKSMFPPRLWQRVFVALVAFLPNKYKEILAGKKNIFGKTLRLYKKHPLWGSHLAAKAGSKEKIISLILNHHQPLTAAERILSQADNNH
ncbi:MAG: hypothetical protein ACOX7U_02775 [Desulfitobacteriia bacterium]|jgi:hypothetical protein